MTCNVADDYGLRRLMKIFLRRQKRRFQFRFFFSSEETKSHALFHDCHRESPELCSLFLKIGLNFNVSLLKVLVPRFIRINY